MDDPSAPANDRAGDEETIASSSAAVVPDRRILTAPRTQLSLADAEKFAPIPRAIPVLLFHVICAPTCPEDETYGMTLVEFARTFEMLEYAGYKTISVAEYARFLNGDVAGLPRSPILVTFDDGRLDAYRGADDVLRQANARATMYIITDRPQQALPTYMLWSEIAAAQASGRWDIQVHADKGHSLIPVGVSPTGETLTGPSYANRRYDPKEYAKLPGHLEPITAWRTRVRADIDSANALLRSKVFGYAPITMAVPFGNYGQLESNDPAIAADLAKFLATRFEFFMTQPLARPDFSVPSSVVEKHRFTIRRTTTAELIYAWLATTEKKRAFLALPAQP